MAIRNRHKPKQAWRTPGFLKAVRLPGLARERGGVVLVLVLIVVALLTLAGLTFSELMFSENLSARVQGRAVQSRMLADSAVDYVRWYLLQPEADQTSLGGHFDNVQLFQGVLVQDDSSPKDRGRFAVLAPFLDDQASSGTTGIRFGLEDESSRLNLNALTYIEEQAAQLGDLTALAGSLGAAVGGAAPAGGTAPAGGAAPAGGTGGAAPGGAGGTTGGTGGTGGAGGAIGTTGGAAGGGTSTGGATSGAASSTGGMASGTGGLTDLQNADPANAGRTILMGLPYMTEDVADAILDYIDEDDDPRPLGAEVDFYATLEPPYMPKNGPLESVEELLLVRGVTPELLFGADQNRNGMLDSNESLDGLGLDNSMGSMERGWSAYLTLYSMERNLRPDGTARINVNQDDLETLQTQLLEVFDQDVVSFILGLRQSGPYEGTVAPESINGRSVDLAAGGGSTFSNVLDILAPMAQIRFEGADQAVVIQNPLGASPLEWSARLPAIMDNLATSDSPVIPGRINLNQAPRTVLLGIPGISDQIVDQIVSRRDPEKDYGEDAPHRHETWILSELIVTIDEMKALMPFLTGGGNVYRAQVVGYFDEGGTATRAEVVIDATAPPPRVVFWRDLSHLGRGFRLETLGTQIAQ